MFTQGLGWMCGGGDHDGGSKSKSRSRSSLSMSSSAEALSREQQAKMPPKRAEWWQVTLYIINDTIGAWLILYSSMMLGMYGWILGILLLVLLWPLNLFTAHLLWRCR